MYSKLINKIITILAIISFLGIQIMPAVSMAAEEINQNIATNEENVKFNATLNGTGSYTMEADLNQNPTIDFEINVQKTGYLKNIVVEAKDANYELLNDLEESQTAINSIKGNTINFNNIDAGNTATASVKIKVIKEDVTKYEMFDKVSSVVLKATYVNKDGNEKEIKKELKEQVKWNTKAEADLNLELLRYLKYENNRTMVSIKVSDGIKDNSIPALTKEITIDVPRLNGQDSISGWHTYSCEWMPDHVYWYLDGNLVNSYFDRTHIPRHHLTLKTNYAIDGYAVEKIYDNNHVLIGYNPVWRDSDTMTIGYIRVYQLKWDCNNDKVIVSQNDLDSFILNPYVKKSISIASNNGNISLESTDKVTFRVVDSFEITGAFQADSGCEFTVIMQECPE